MNLLPLAELGGFGAAAISILGILIVVFVFLVVWASRYTKVGPNEVLVISGRKRRIIDPDGKSREVGFRVVKGGGVFVWPVFEKVDILSLELLTIDVQIGRAHV